VLRSHESVLSSKAFSLTSASVIVAAVLGWDCTLRAAVLIVVLEAPTLLGLLLPERRQLDAKPPPQLVLRSARKAQSPPEQQRAGHRDKRAPRKSLPLMAATVPVQTPGEQRNLGEIRRTPRTRWLCLILLVLGLSAGLTAAAAVLALEH